MYRVETDELAEHDIAALPPEALASYAEALAVLEVNPWGGNPYRASRPDAAVRTLTFGTGGMVIYLVLEDQRRVDVLHVLWLG